MNRLFKSSGGITHVSPYDNVTLGVVGCVKTSESGQESRSKIVDYECGQGVYS